VVPLAPDDNLYFNLMVHTPGDNRTCTLTVRATQKDSYFKKCGDFTNIYYGEICTKAAAVFISKNIAIKRIRFDPKDNDIKRSILTMLELRKDKWALLNHPNISPTWPLMSSTGPIPAVAMPWFGNGNVLDFTHRWPHINMLIIVKPIAGAVQYIHTMGEVHGNIVPANVLIADNGKPYLSDVGVNSHMLKVTYSNNWPIPSDWVFKAMEELSPQDDPAVFRITKAMDTYAFACTVYAIFTSKPPCSPKPYGKGMNEKIAGGCSIQKPAEISSSLWKLLQRCLSYDPNDRPSMATVAAELMTM